MKDNLGNRMKDYYENRTKSFLPRRTYSIIRIDGKSFHTYTRGLKKPFDEKLINDMDETAKYLCENIQGTKFAFVQSDEISLLLTDFDNLQTSAWFDGNIQKITSISASLATAKFNELRPNKIALFDSRVFTIPSNIEVENYFIWRQQDTVRNSISSVAQSLYSHKELHNKNVSEMQEMCFKKGINWDNYSPKYKRGRLIVKEYYNKNNTKRSRWVSIVPSIFTQKRDELNVIIPIL
jgi:tRNA(His) 5'-end guanylyltransferase